MREEHGPRCAAEGVLQQLGQPVIAVWDGLGLSNNGFNHVAKRPQGLVDLNRLGGPFPQ
eukprot:CAMPEP_0179151520 /NCGR_PEP_ID=MMETSP0796-20121207/73568_1 /TAXON_ID=73915 /ORGANISM="Pyrodinium bahamense, Strain pbaha01" /LENGTH=58 /DNA_ID=CAMNT_0020852625 /DNA_START=125 /DNA_END=301 /DNA_ORIENTATION=+